MILMLSAILLAQLGCALMIWKISQRTRKLCDQLASIRAIGFHSDNDNPDAVL